jgi:CRISPR-associated protein Cmr4
VRKGGLWYEENLPPESLLYGIWGALPVRSTKLSPEDACSRVWDKNPRYLQLGGKASVGRGFIELRTAAQ